jgi:hypothetical protein
MKIANYDNKDVSSKHQNIEENWELIYFMITETSSRDLEKCILKVTMARYAYVSSFIEIESSIFDFSFGSYRGVSRTRRRPKA